MPVDQRDGGRTRRIDQTLTAETQTAMAPMIARQLTGTHSLRHWSISCLIILIICSFTSHRMFHSVTQKCNGTFLPFKTEISKEFALSYIENDF